MKKRFSLQVEIENDGNCAALAEKISGNAKNCTDFICVVIGTGIAGGIFVDGKILNGHSFRGEEIGFMITQTGKDYYDLWNHTGSTSALIHSYKNLKGIGEFENIKGETVFLEAAKSNFVRRLLDDWIKINSYKVGTNTRIEGCKIIGNVIIGDGCDLTDAVIGPNVAIEDGCIVRHCSIENSILLKNTLVDTPCLIINSILGRESILQGGNIAQKIVRCILEDYSMYKLN